MDAQTLLSSEQHTAIAALEALKKQQAQTAACASLDQELALLQVEALELEGRGEDLSERTAAAERMARFENDRLIVLGKSGTVESEKLGKLCEQLNSEASMIQRRKSVIAERCQAIIAEKGVVLSRSAEDFKEAAVALIRDAENVLSRILDETRSHLNSLELQLGTSIYKPEELTSPERSESWVTLNRLYRGRG